MKAATARRGGLQTEDNTYNRSPRARGSDRRGARSLHAPVTATAVEIESGTSSSTTTTDADRLPARVIPERELPGNKYKKQGLYIKLKKLKKLSDRCLRISKEKTTEGDSFKLFLSNQNRR